MTQTTQGSLTMVGLNTEAPSVFWNGAEVAGITCITVVNCEGSKRVVLTLREDPTVLEMQAAGITIKRGSV